MYHEIGDRCYSVSVFKSFFRKLKAFISIKDARLLWPLILISLIVRLPLFFRDWSLGTDDGIYAISARHVAEGNLPFRNVFSSQGGWFLEIQALPVWLMRNVYFAPRIMSLVTGIAITILVFKISSRLMSRNWAFIAGMLTALSGSIIRTTSAITSDGMVVAFSLLCILLALNFVEHETNKNSLFLGLALGFGCSVKSIFMIPTIIFLIVLTYKSSIRARALALGASLIVFILPYIFFGFKNVWNQSIAYHLDKDDPLKLKSNIAKITSTVFKFDAFLVLALLFVVSMIMFLVIKKGRPQGLNKNIKLLSFAYGLPTLLLLLFQTPLFRNHVVLIAPVAIIIIAYTLSEHIRLKRPEHYAFLGLVMLFPLVFSAINLYTDSAFRKEKGYVETRFEIEAAIMPNKIMLTNDPGLAFDTHQDIPLGLEDTSKYRFLSSNDALKLNDDSFAKYLKDSNVCTIVINDKNDDRQFDISDKIENNLDWFKEPYVDGRYKLWENTSSRCLKPTPDFYDPGDGTGKFTP